MKLQGYVNRIKCEKYTDFNDSVFKTVYEDAVSLTKKIISANQYYKEHSDSEIEKFCNEDHIATIISFLGDRGVGKSSAMLSYAHYLDCYNRKTMNDADMFLGKKEVDFCVFPKIDVTMLTHEEGLFDVVLAKMWDKFFEKVEKGERREPSQENVRKKFEDVKKSYNRWSVTQKESGVSQLAELHGLSQSLNLREDFSKLVTEFSKYTGKEKDSENYLVFAIDDLDMVIESAYMRLEELRLLLTIPKVIVLITADMNQLILNIQNIWKMRLRRLPEVKGDWDCPTGVRLEESMYENIARDYAVKYLAKVLPQNMRIFLPNSNEITDQCLQEVYVEIVEKGFEAEVGEAFLTRQRLIDVLLRKKTGRILYCSKLAEANEKISLRDTIDKIAGLDASMTSMGELSVENWMKKEILADVYRLKDKEQSELVMHIFDGNATVFERYFLSFIVALEDEIWLSSGNGGYRGTIENLVCLCNEKIEWAEFIRLMVWIYVNVDNFTCPDCSLYAFYLGLVY